MNPQTIPRDDKTVKAAFVPKLDAFIWADYPQIELKILAYYLESIGHPSMADVFRAGGDLYVETAAGVFQKPASQVTDAERQIGKRLDLSIVYGGGMPTLMEQLGITAKEALDLLKGFHSTWPGIGWETKRKKADPGTLAHAIKMRLDERGYIATLYGRHLRPHSPHVRINALCQGCAGDLMKASMVTVYQNLVGRESHIVNMVHDELMLDCREDEIPWVVSNLPDWMTDERLESVVPIKPSCDISWTTWADKEPYG